MASEEIIQSMLLNAPDPNDPIPISNRTETIYGTVVPFLVVTWLAVGLRLWVRLRVMHEPGWDDVFVLLALILSTAATVLVLASIRYGFGHHFLYIGIENMAIYLKLFYIENALYISNTAVIKISLLLQYLRIFKAGTMRWICLSLLAIVASWGLTYGFMAWFPCFPVKAFWQRAAYPNAKCYGFGFAGIEEFVAVFESHTALNMVFDTAIFFTPMVLFSKPNLRRNNVLAMGGIFLMGATVVFTSVWRLQSIVASKAATTPYIDFTWWTPISVVLSCLETDLAIICASMPVFWPVIDKSVSAIFVTHEVRITEHQQLDDDDECFELDNQSTQLKGVVSSESGHSRETLHRQPRRNAEFREHYTDPYNIAHVDPFANESIAIQTNVDTAPKEKWRM